MFLLPIHFIKDAARSVKRILKDEFIKTTDTALTKLLGISTLIVTMYNLRREGEHEVLHLWCVRRVRAGPCARRQAFHEALSVRR